MSNPRGPRDGGLTAETLDSLLTAGAVVLMLASMVWLAVLISSTFSSPRVGDLLIFKPGTRVADMDTVVARRSGATGPQATCVLNPEVMVNGGGSIVVEARSVTGQAYNLHWAGAQTAAAPHDCGRSAELIVSTADLRLLVTTMGGRGLAGRGHVF